MAAAWLLSRKIESELFNVQPADPKILTAAAAILALVAIAAALIPALRAARISPVTALKYE